MVGLLRALLVAVLVSGCSGEDPGPTAVEPVGPAAALPADPAVGAGGEDAVAFVRSWFAELDAAFVRRDSGGLRRMSTASCLSCASFAATVDALRTRRVVRDGPGVVVLSAQAPPPEDDRATVDLHVDIPGQVDRAEGSGAVVLRTRPARGLRWLAVLEPAGGGWRLADLRPVTA